MDKVEYRRLFQNVYMYIPCKVYWRHIRSLKRLSEDKASLHTRRVLLALCVQLGTA